MNITSKVISDYFGKKLDRAFGIKNCLFEYNPGNFVMTPHFSKFAPEIFDFKVLKDDVWVISYPRTGSTWCQEMVWLLGNDLNYEEANNSVQQFRAPLLELSSVLVTDEYKDFMVAYGNSIKVVENQKPPRFIKSHLPLGFLPKNLKEIKPKIIYVARNPKDVCVSYYYHCQQLYDLNCTFEDFCELFLNGKVPIGSIWSHYLPYWNQRDELDILFLMYEDVQRDLREVIVKTAKYMNRNYSEAEINQLSKYLDFGSMKNNRSVNFQTILESRTSKNRSKDCSTDFIRNGKIGDAENYMTKEMSLKFDEWIAQNTKNTGLSF